MIVPNSVREQFRQHLAEKLKYASYFRERMERAMMLSYHRMLFCQNDAELRASYEYANDVWKEASKAENDAQLALRNHIDQHQ